MMETTNRKPRRVLLIGVVAILLLVVIGVLYLSINRADAADEKRASVINDVAADEVVVDEAFVISIEAMDDSIERTMDEDHLLGLSSNPYDYISDGKNEYYNKIVALGPAALPELEAALFASEESGLAEYLLAVAIEEVAQADVRSIERWGTAEEFRGLWFDIKQTIPERVDAIVQSGDLNAGEKIEQLSVYGVLALPELDRVIQEGGIAEELAFRLKEHVESISSRSV
jgi:hypothetical protein